jgi:hypothetical protein
MATPPRWLREISAGAGPVANITCGALGCVVGFGAGVAWDNRRLAASIASAAMRNIGRVRDEHWLDRHPIDYA